MELVQTTSYNSDNYGLLAQNMSFGDFVLLVISVFVLLAGVMSIFFILWGGLLFILSGGKEDKIKPAVNTIRYAVVGLILTVISIFIFPILGRLLGLDVEKYVEPSKIFAKIQQIGEEIFGGNSNDQNTINSVNTINSLPSDFSDL